MKKLLVVLLAVCLLFAFAACGSEPATDEIPVDEQQGEVVPDDVITPEETPDYTGEYTNENGDTVSLIKNEDNTYAITIGITRLTTFEGTGNIMDGAVEFIVTDPNGGEVDGIFYPAAEGDTYEVNFTVSNWELLEAGSIFTGFTAAK